MSNEIKNLSRSELIKNFVISNPDYYLKEFKSILKPKGDVLFTYKNLDLLDVNDSLFTEHTERLMRNREFQTRSISYASPSVIKNVAEQIGYKYVEVDDNVDITLSKGSGEDDITITKKGFIEDTSISTGKLKVTGSISGSSLYVNSLHVANDLMVSGSISGCVVFGVM